MVKKVRLWTGLWDYSLGEPDSYQRWEYSSLARSEKKPIKKTAIPFGEKVACPDCGQKVTRRRLQRHRRKVHGIMGLQSLQESNSSKQQRSESHTPKPNVKLTEGVKSQHPAGTTSQYPLQPCPYCKDQVRSDRMVHHLRRVHGK